MGRIWLPVRSTEGKIAKREVPPAVMMLCPPPVLGVVILFWWERPPNDHSSDGVPALAGANPMIDLRINDPNTTNEGEREATAMPQTKQ